MFLDATPHWLKKKCPVTGGEVSQNNIRLSLKYLQSAPTGGLGFNKDTENETEMPFFHHLI